MHRQFIAFIVTVALVATGLSATAAQAQQSGYRKAPMRPAYMNQQVQDNGNKTVAAAIAGVAALFIIGASIERHNDRRKKEKQAEQARRKAAARKAAKQRNARNAHGRAHRGGHAHWHSHDNGVDHIHQHESGHHWHDH